MGTYESSNLKFLVVKSSILNYGKNVRVPCFDFQTLKTGFSYLQILHVLANLQFVRKYAETGSLGISTSW